ncbi:DUF3987 domain-containing protein [Paraburkholderia sp. D1E]|uniref:DUF3987 domain-containing protein n=1 Tax=Paraburkholderia sp. D1E TaxID=3461398 RepID=UPI0040464397
MQLHLLLRLMHSDRPTRRRRRINGVMMSNIVSADDAESGHRAEADEAGHPEYRHTDAPHGCPEPFRGPMAQMVGLSLRYQNRRQPELTVAAALAAMSACMNGQWALSDELRGNLYIVGLAETGAGKDGPLKLVKNVLDVAGVSGDVISNVGSGQGMEDSLLRSTHARASLVVDEVGHLIAGFGKGAAAHTNYAEKMLLEGYSAGSSFITTRALAKRPPMRIPNPHLTLFGTTTFASMGRVSPGLVDNGLMGRCLVVAGLDLPSLVDALHGSLRGDLEQTIGPLAHAVAHSGGIVPMTEGARECERQLSHELDQQARLADGVRRTLAMRTIEHIKRVALVLAVWNDIQVVTPEHMEWAAHFVAFCQSCLLRFVDDMTDSPVVRNAHKVEQIIREAVAGRRPFKTAAHDRYNDIAADSRLTGRAALLKASRLSSAELESAITYLVGIGVVAIVDVKRLGSAGAAFERYYRLVE